MVKFLIKLLGEARGNAVYDFIKTWGWPAMLTALTGFVGWFKHAPMWQVWVAVAVVCLISYAIAFWVNRNQNQNPIERPKRKTKKERDKELSDKIARRHFPERFETESQALSINARCMQCSKDDILFYCCRVSVRNHKKKPAEQVAVLLQNIEPLPSAARRIPDWQEHEMRGARTALTLPTIFPIEIRPVVGDGKTIPPETTAEFDLFKLVRHGNIPTIRFLGKSNQDEYSMFTPETVEGGTAFMFKPYRITISAQSLNCAAIYQTFRVTFQAGMDMIPKFAIEKET